MQGIKEALDPLRRSTGQRRTKGRTKAVLMVRMPHELYERLSEAAEVERVSRNSLALVAIERALDELEHVAAETA